MSDSDSGDEKELVGYAQVMLAVRQVRQPEHHGMNRGHQIEVVTDKMYDMHSALQIESNDDTLRVSSDDGPMNCVLDNMEDTTTEVVNGAIEGQIPSDLASSLLVDIVRAKTQTVKSGMGLSFTSESRQTKHFEGIKNYTNHVGKHDAPTSTKASAIIPANWITKDAESKWPNLYEVFQMVQACVGTRFKLMICNILFGASNHVAFNYHQDTKEHSPLTVHLSVCCELSDSGSTMKIAGPWESLVYSKPGTYFIFDSALWHRSGIQFANTIKVCFFFAEEGGFKHRGKYLKHWNAMFKPPVKEEGGGGSSSGAGPSGLNEQVQPAVAAPADEPAAAVKPDEPVVAAKTDEQVKPASTGEQVEPAETNEPVEPASTDEPAGAAAIGEQVELAVAPASVREEVEDEVEDEAAEAAETAAEVEGEETESRFYAGKKRAINTEAEDEPNSKADKSE